MDKSALEVIKKYWYTAPVDVYAIIRALNIELVFPNLLESMGQLSGYIEKSDGRYRIGVNGSDHEVRQRFTAAHELGHFIYHRHLIDAGVDDDRLYRSMPGGKYYNTNIGDSQERQANQFAANLLMPTHLLKDLKNRGFNLPADLAAELNVSKPAMRIRLGLPPDPAATDPHEEIKDGRVGTGR